jgi:hypothetical protein
MPPRHDCPRFRPLLLKFRHAPNRRCDKREAELSSLLWTWPWMAADAEPSYEATLTIRVDAGMVDRQASVDFESATRGEISDATEASPPRPPQPSKNNH